MLITGTVYEQPITILNVYAPNEDSPEFISKIYFCFDQYSKGLGICAGDFNCVMKNGQKILKSASKTLTHPRAPLVFKELCNESGISDV